MTDQQPPPAPTPGPDQGPGQGPSLGTWARSGDLVGLVAAVSDGTATLFAPGERQITEVPVGELETVPVGAVRVAVTVDLPLPHGLAESTLRRWVAALTDEVLHERARDALVDAGLDPGAMLPQPQLEVLAGTGSDAVCLCGQRTPASGTSTVPCHACGRPAAAPPRRAD